MKAFLVFLVLVMAAQAELPDNPQPVCQQALMDDAGHVTFKTIDCSQVPDFQRRVLPPQKPPQHHNWAYRHPLIIGAIGGGTFALIYGLTHRTGCPHYINGVKYDGNGRPCPTRCDSDGDCYWPK